MTHKPLLVLLIALFLALRAGPASAAQTAFWRPHTPDKYTYALFHFDGRAVDDGGKCGPGELSGDAALTDEGKFGGALKLGGHGAAKFMPSEVYSAGAVCLEAWVKLDCYPDKEACVIFRRAIVDESASYDPKVDRAQGFQLTVGSKGALHLQVTNVLYGYTIRTSSPDGAVPLHEWVHVAGLTGGLGSYRRVYVNGRELAGTAVTWGQSLWGEEKEATPVFVGNDDKGDAGLTGIVDEVRIHGAIVKLWRPEDMAWATATSGQPLPGGAPYFLEGHQPTLSLPLDGDFLPAGPSVPGLSVDGKGAQFMPGVRGQGCRGPFTLNAPSLLDLREGSIEFWMQPIGVENFTDFCQGFLSFGPANLYIFNAGVITPGGLPLSMFFYRNGKAVFVGDDTVTELHEGAWYHVVLTWKGEERVLYLKGKRVGANADAEMAFGGQDLASQLSFTANCEVDELRLYGRALFADEVANSYLRFLDPARLKPVKLLVLEIAAGYLPSSNTIFYTLTPQVPAAQVRQVRLRLLDQTGKELMHRETDLLPGEQRLIIPPLASGTYTLTTDALGPDGKTKEGESFVFERKHFVWEGNRLGMDETVYPPLEPVAVKANRASVVLRSYAMNGFGLWDQVTSEGRDLLAGPMRLRLETAGGEVGWTRVSGSFREAKPARATYAGEAVSAPLQVKTACEIETDGCMKVTMDLLPGAKPETIRRLWIEVPLRDREAPLMHVVTDGPRVCYSGATPPGVGAVWDGSKANWYNRWLNAFVPYIWLGAEERGLAWFAENDRGWLTEKGGSKAPVQELVREGDRLTLRIYLCNTPATLTKPSRLVFGLQASPTKPLPPDWRRKLTDIPGGLPVVPWGGLHCSYQTPYHDDWTIADKIVEARYTGKVDTAWFEDYAKRKDPPPAAGNWPWVDMCGWFSAWCARVGPARPITCYQEEMAASMLRDEYHIYQDEWRPSDYALSRACPDESFMRQGREAGPSAGTTFPASYRDFGVYVADQWLKRGISLYWDNTFPHVSLNTRDTAAYPTQGGAIQPCVIIWNQREYQKRVWQRLQYWRTQRKEPLEWVLHMTNTLLLPVHTWGTADLDHEYVSKTPFSPDWLRTETTGRQIGNYGLSLYAVAGSQNDVVNKLPDDRRERVEWGMRVVHEIQHAGKLDHLLTDFGYGTDAVRVGNYWSEAPMLRVADAGVKWISLAKPQAREMLVVLASWSPQDAQTQISVDGPNLGFDAAGLRLTDAETGEVLATDALAPATVQLPGPYGVRILKLSR